MRHTQPANISGCDSIRHLKREESQDLTADTPQNLKLSGRLA